MIDYSYYPFLKGSLQYRHINEFDEQSILYAQDNIEKYTPTKQLELDTQVWLISTIMLRCLNNNFITRKFVSNYSKLFESHLTKDFKNKEIRLEVLDYFRIKNKKDIEFQWCNHTGRVCENPCHGLPRNPRNRPSSTTAIPHQTITSIQGFCVYRDSKVRLSPAFGIRTTSHF